LAHYGILRKSGRYPWGSGEHPCSAVRRFWTSPTICVNRVCRTQIAKAFPWMKRVTLSKSIRYVRGSSCSAFSGHDNSDPGDRFVPPRSLQDKGMGYSAIARQMDLKNESTVRSLLEPGRLDKLNVLQQTSDMLKRQVEEKEFVDVGPLSKRIFRSTIIRQRKSELVRISSRRPSPCSKKRVITFIRCLSSRSAPEK
jgi:hypothetical protein